MTDANPPHPSAPQLPARATDHRKQASAAAIAGLIILLIAVTVQKLWSADFWWQLKLGEWIIDHRAIPTQEMFTHSRAGTPLLEMRWLYCVAIAWLWHHAGAAALVLLQSAVVTACFGLVLWPIRRQLLTPLMLLTAALALLAGFNRWVVRPELVTDIMAAAFLVILERSTRDRRWKGLWLLPFLQVIWMNGHTTSIFGPLLVWAFFGADLLASLSQRTDPATPSPSRVHLPLLIAALLTTAACWVNPFGHRGALYFLDLFAETRAGHATAETVTEMYSPFEVPLSAWGWDLWAGMILGILALGSFTLGRASETSRSQMYRFVGSMFIVIGSLLLVTVGETANISLRVLLAAPGLILVAGGTLMLRFQAGHLARFAVLLLALYLLATMQRNLGLASIMLAWVASRSIADLHALPTAGKLRQGQAAALATAALSLLMAGTAWYIATDRYAVAHSLSREFGLGVVEWYQPRGAEKFILDHKPQPQLFNIVRDGSYFAWRVSDTMPIFIDGRTDAAGPDLLKEVSSIAPANWDAFASRHAVNTAVIPVRDYGDVAAYLYNHPDWSLVHLDPTSYVFLRNTPQNALLIAAGRVDLSKWAPPSPEPDDRPPAWKAAYGGVGRAWYNAGMAAALAQLRAHTAAIPYYEKAVANAPTVLSYKLALAPYYIVMGKSADAERLLEGVSHAQLAAVDRATAQLLTDAGHPEAAIAPAQRALDANPDDHQLRIAVADLHFRTGNFAKARDYYTIALRAGVGTWNELNKLAHAHAQTGNLQEAARAYRASLEGNPRQPAIWNLAGELAATMGDLRAAKTCFENALRLSPDLQQARANLDKVNQLLASPPAPPPAGK